MLGSLVKNKLKGLLKEVGVSQVDVISLKGLEKITEVAVWMVDVTLEIPTGRLRHNVTTLANLTKCDLSFFA
jgi:hypothetical protein